MQNTQWFTRLNFLWNIYTYFFNAHKGAEHRSKIKEKTDKTEKKEKQKEANRLYPSQYEMVLNLSITKG